MNFGFVNSIILLCQILINYTSNSAENSQIKSLDSIEARTKMRMVKKGTSFFVFFFLLKLDIKFDFLFQAHSYDQVRTYLRTSSFSLLRRTRFQSHIFNRTGETSG